MGKKHVVINNGFVDGVFDEDNNNVPDGSFPITANEFLLIRGKKYSFSDFEMVGGALQVRTEAEDNRKSKVVDGFSIDMFKAFAELIMDELNTLRAEHSLPPRTMAQLKTAMKNKLL